MNVAHLDVTTVESAIDWSGAMNAIVAGHQLAAPELDDTLLRRGNDALLSRAAMIDGLGALVKTATVFPGNATHEVSTINGSVALFSDRTGQLDATIDFHLLTKWKTAADSALAASRLARPNSTRILIVGSGVVARSMIDAYRAVFPGASISLWSRTVDNARDLAAEADCEVVNDLQVGVAAADVVCTATMSSTPVVLGRWLRPGQHLDLIGGYRPDMREIDDDAVQRSVVFADSFATALHVGDIAGPLDAGLLERCDIVDFNGLNDATFARPTPEAITVCKNAGGAHLDLMVARYMFDAVS